MAPGLPDKVPATAGRDNDGDLPVPAQEASGHARVYDDAGSADVSRMRRLPCCLLLVRRASAPRICLTPIGRLKLSQLNVPTIRNFEDMLREKDRSPTMVRYVIRSLGALLAEHRNAG